MTNCIFCAIVSKKQPAFIVYEDSKTLVFLDKNPQSRGHLQLIPKEHYRWVYEIPYISNFSTTAQHISRAIISVLGADHVSWATFGHEIEHAHLWIVPHYKSSQKIKEGLKVSTFKNVQTELQKLLTDAIRGEVSNAS